MTSDAEHDKRHSDHMSEDGDSDAPKQPKFQLDASSKAQMDGARRDVVAQNVKDTLDRYKFLLGQTDLFAHFIKSKGLLDKQTIAAATGASNAAGKKKVTGESRRGRKTEKEEDEELLNDELAEEADPAAPLSTETVFTESPKYVTGGKLREYQVHGLNWMISLFEHGINGILADEMGLGKTLQTIAFLGYLKHYRSMPGPNLVLVPKSTLQNWVNEFHRWVPDFKVLLFHGSKDERAELVKNELFSNTWEICVTSYETCMAEKTHLRKFAWQYIVIDEAHRIKNENSLLSQIMRTFTCRNRMLITGTPLQNNLRELWALLNFLLPDIFTTFEEFDEYLQGNGGQEDQDAVISQLHAVLRPFLLRRLKADVEKSLLPKKRINLYVGMSDMQREWYQRILSKDVEAINGAVRDNREGKTRLLNIVMQLRKCCNHPYLFDGAEPGPPYTTDQHLVDNSGKMVVLDKLLTTLQGRGSRVLLFSQMSRVLDILEDYCLWRGFQYCRLDGSTAHEDRVRDIDEFNRPGSEKFIYLLTTRAGGLGINLATADTVVMYDSDWNPQVDLQAEDRAHRIGQKKQVVVFRFITENAIEDKVIERAASKLRLDQLVIQQGRIAQQNKVLSKNELVNMIKHGADQILNGPSFSLAADESIEDIIRKGEERTALLDKKFEHLGLDDLQRFESQGMYQFEGKDFSNVKRGAMPLNWIAPARREKKVGGYSVDEYYRQQLSTSTRTNEPKQPRPPRQLTIADFQFFPARLQELQRKELLYFWKEIDYKVPVDTPSENAEETEEELEARRAEEQAKIEKAEPLTEEERAEMEQLRTEGFHQWNKRDFNAFIRGCEKYGRDKLEDIANEMEGKTLDEVRTYAECFWERYEELDDHESVVERVERGEEKIRKRNQIQEQLSSIVRQYRFPLQQLQINYGNTQKGKNYTEEEDRFMVVALQKHGYNTEDVYEVIRKEIRQHPSFRFDWFIKSRSAAELNRRCTTLINLLMKDMDLDEEGAEARGNAPSGRGKRRGGAAAAGGDRGRKSRKTVK